MDLYNAKRIPYCLKLQFVFQEFISDISLDDQSEYKTTLESI